MNFARGSDIIPTEPPVFALLVLLIENRDRVVSKDDVIEPIWDGRIISYATLISAARQAVGDSGSKQSVIRTVSRRGFQFIAQIGDSIAPSVSENESEIARPQIRSCSTPDGIDLPFAISGQGPTLIKVANWLNHLEHDWTSPIWRSLFQAFSRDCSLLRYGSRGVGLAN
jgi:DNA-binding winged helix-turn-helix (wHTH) protein